MMNRSKSMHGRIRNGYASALIAALLMLPAASLAQEESEELALPEDAAETAHDAAGYGLEQANAARQDGYAYGKSRAEARGENATSGAGASGGVGGAAGGGAGGGAAAAAAAAGAGGR